MTDPKRETTFSFSGPEGRVEVHRTGHAPDIAETWALWVMSMRALLRMNGLSAEYRKLVQDTYSALKITRSGDTHRMGAPHLQIVTVYRTGNEFTAVAFGAGPLGPIATGWKHVGSYPEVADRIKGTFGELERIPRAPDDAPEIYESWI